jgi:hypothetical protein
MNEEYRNVEQSRDAGLTTKAVAPAMGPSMSKTDADLGAREAERKRTEVSVGKTSALEGNGVAAEPVPAALVQDDHAAPLFSTEEAKKFRFLWDAIQGGFVDEPRQAVGKADSLLAEAMKRLAEMFADERSRLDGQWERGDTVSTEELRVALRCYRSFFGRLLSI